MAEVSKAKVFLSTGTDLRFVNGTRYHESGQIANILKVTDGLLCERRIFHLGAFDDTHLAYTVKVISALARHVQTRTRSFSY